MYSRTDLLREAREVLDRVWFLQQMEEIARTDHTLSLRLYIRNDLFIQVFLGETSGSLYLALIERERRIFGVDREAGEWHIHPYDTPDQHQNLPEALEPKPLLKFIARVETLLLDHDLL